MREAFRTESSEEFMSLVYALDAEAGGPDEAAASAASLELEWTLTGRVPPAARPVLTKGVVLPLPARPAARPAASVPARPVARPGSESVRPAALSRVAHPFPSRSTLVDELTGIGGPLALRRDVMLESSLPSRGGPRFALITVDVHPVAEVRQRRGPAVADQLLKTLVEAVRVSLRESDNIYRSGADELTLLLRGCDPGAGDQARMELEAALRRALAERGLPSIRLATETEHARPVVAEREAAAV